MKKNKRELNLGYSDFKNIIENNNYFIDKSLLIKDVIKAQKAVLLLPRPRRFGKTLNLSMLKYFFDIQQPENKILFSELKIWKTENEIKEKQGKYPVIYLSFKDSKKDNWKSCYAHIRAELVNLYGQYRYLLESDVLYGNEKNKYLKILNETAEPEEYENSIKQLCKFLSRYHKQNVVILIDEYDTPIQAGYNKFYAEAISFMRSLMSGAFKDNTNLYKGVITGILRISKESIFTGLNNLSVHSIMNYDFSDKFGFTEDEIKQLLIDFELSDKYPGLKKWYNGYRFGDTENIYNPWSVLSFVTTHREGFNTFWVNTSSDELLKEEIRKKDADYIREELLNLINYKTIEKDIEQNFVFPDMKSDKDLLWTLLTYSGYLTQAGKIKNERYKLRIPNYEIRRVFEKIIIKWLKTDVKIRLTLLEETANYLVNNQIDKFEYGFRQIIGDTFSYFDSSQNPEFVYQSYTLGLLAILGDDYILKSNRESGEGRYDILLIPHDKSKYGIVIEIKQIENQTDKEPEDRFTKRVNKMLEKATSQIDKNEYYKELIDNKIEQDKIIKLPIVFAGKTPYIRMILQK